MFDNNSFFKQIKLKNFLSYGERGTEIKCNPLNVFIGPNASGKSNFIEALRLLSKAPLKGRENNIANMLNIGGGISEWIWKGGTENAIAHVEAITEGYFDFNIRYVLEFRISAKNQFELYSEALIRQKKGIANKDHQPDYYYEYGHTPTLVAYKSKKEKDELVHNLDAFDFANASSLDLNRSILAQRDDFERFPNISYIAEKFLDIKIYRDWNLGYKSPIKTATKSDAYPDFLLNDASNIWLILHNILEPTDISNMIFDYLFRFSSYFEHIIPSVKGGDLTFFIKEKGLNSPVSITRLSEGYIRFLCLLSILCHPEPPSVICIEEPELCMHPDIIPTIAELLIQASERTQLFVTTHSDILISALTDQPESVIVCERDENGSILKRLKKKDLLEEWLEKYKLGDLWLMNKIGGNP